jgi:hypothetical protein
MKRFILAGLIAGTEQDESSEQNPHPRLGHEGVGPSPDGHVDRDEDLWTVCEKIVKKVYPNPFLTKRIHNFLHRKKQPKNAGSFCKQCDQIGRNFAIWEIFFGVGRIFFTKYIA